LDTALIIEMATHYQLLVTIEENVVMGGAGSAVNEALQAAALTIPILNLGLPDHFIEHGNTDTLLAQCGLNAAGIHNAIIHYQSKLIQHKIL